jgi:hypothetical protein
MAINNSKQPEPPLPQLVEILAEGGEVDRLLAKLNERLGWTDRLEVLRALSRAIEATGEIGGVPGLIELAFTSMLKVSMAMMLRVQLLAEADGNSLDEDIARGQWAGGAHSLHQTVLPQLQKLQLHIANLAKLYGTVQHTLSIAERDRAAAMMDHATAAPENGSRQRSQMKVKASRDAA